MRSAGDEGYFLLKREAVLILTRKVISEQRFEAVEIDDHSIWRNIPHKGNSTAKALRQSVLAYVRNSPKDTREMGGEDR